MTTFNAIDVETANSDRASICQIGIVQVRNGQVRDQWQTLVNPKCLFSGHNIGIHGIDQKMVKSSPTFPEIINELRARLNGTILVSHTPFDRGALDSAADWHRLEPLRVTWLDSAAIVRRAWPKDYARTGYGLANVAQDLGIAFKHHDALEDARAAAEIVLRACKDKEKSIEEWLYRVTQPIFYVRK